MIMIFLLTQKGGRLKRHIYADSTKDLRSKVNLDNWEINLSYPIAALDVVV